MMLFGCRSAHRTCHRVLPGKAEWLDSGFVPFLNKSVAKTACRASGEGAGDGCLVFVGLAERIAKRRVGACFITKQERCSHLHSRGSKGECRHNTATVHDSARS